MEYVIAGDSGKYKGCLIAPCGKSREHAEKVLQRMLTNPNENDTELIGNSTNLRIETVEDRDCWWNDPFLAN